MHIQESTAFDPTPEDLDARWIDEPDAEDAHRIAMLRIYLSRFGLSDPEALEIAARRILHTVQSRPDDEHVDLERRLLGTARSWVRTFAESAAPGEHWLSRAPALLSRFPSAFLATPLLEREPAHAH